MPNTNQPLALYRQNELYDEREFQVGQVYYIRDDLVVIPDADRIVPGRVIHEGRMVVIAHNSQYNTDPIWPLIHIAPIGHRTDLMRALDIEVKKSACSWLRFDSMIKLALVQPVLKVDLERMVGQLTRDKVAELVSMQEDLLLGSVEELE